MNAIRLAVSNMTGQSDTPLAARFMQGLGLVGISPSELQSRLSTCPQSKEGPWNPWCLVSATDQCHDALEFLSTLTFPLTRHVVFASQSGSALVNNCRDGSSYGGGSVLARFWNCTFARVINSSCRVWTNGVLRVVMKYEARFFELYGPEGNEIRSVARADDGGRWVFETFGQPHPVEASFPYDAKRKAARFMKENLLELSAAFGLPVPTADDFVNAGHYLLYREHVGYPVLSCTIEEADDSAYGYFRRGMGFAKQKTHASSVILDLEKCVVINPAYGPRVESALTEARRTLGRFKK